MMSAMIVQWNANSTSAVILLNEEAPIFSTASLIVLFSSIMPKTETNV